MDKVTTRVLRRLHWLWKHQKPQPIEREFDTLPGAPASLMDYFGPGEPITLTDWQYVLPDDDTP